MSSVEAASPAGDCSGVTAGLRPSTSSGQGSAEEVRECEGALCCTVPPRKDRAGGHKNLTGHIRMYNPVKGWGFIACEEFEGDIFLHSKHVVGSSLRQYIGHFRGSQERTEGAHTVRFDLDLQHKHKPQALNVRISEESELQVAPETPPEPRPARGGRGDALDGLPDCPGGEGAAPDAGVATWAEISVAKKLQARPSGGAAPTVAPTPIAATTSLAAKASMAPVGRRRGVLRMRGLPFSTTPRDVASFFDGFGVRPDDVTPAVRADGSSNGEAYVMFAREELASKALRDRHLRHMGSRYIELFPCKFGDAVAGLVRLPLAGMPGGSLPAEARSRSPPGTTAQAAVNTPPLPHTLPTAAPHAANVAYARYCQQLCEAYAAPPSCQAYAAPCQHYQGLLCQEVDMASGADAYAAIGPFVGLPAVAADAYQYAYPEADAGSYHRRDAEVLGVRMAYYTEV